MFRMWVRLIRDNHLIRDTVICDDSADTRTHKVVHALDSACYEFDLGKPIWLQVAINDFKLHGKCRFTKDSFIEDIPFDYMEIQIIEEE